MKMIDKQKIDKFNKRLDDYHTKCIAPTGKAYCWNKKEDLTGTIQSKLDGINNGTYNTSTSDDLYVNTYDSDNEWQHNYLETSNKFYGSQCHGFAQYILSLCSGEVMTILTKPDTSTPLRSSSWMVFRTYENADFGGLQKGDFVRRNEHDGSPDIHSAIVYDAKNPNDVVFLQTLYPCARVYTNKGFNGGAIRQYNENKGDYDRIPVKTKADILANADFIARYVPGETIVTMTLVDAVTGIYKKDQRISGHEIGTLPYEDDPNFDGWYIGDSKHTEGQTVSTDITLTARWKSTTTTVKIKFCRNFDKNDTNFEELAVESGKSLNEYNSLFSRTGYTLQGWVAESNGNALFDKAPSYPCTLYAKWKPIEYTLQFDWARGFNDPNKKTKIKYKYGTSISPAMIKQIPELYAVNHDVEFKYWAKYENGEYVRLTGSITLTGDLTLYAMFRTYNNTILFNGNGGTNLSSVKTKGKRYYEIGTNVPTRTGYKFIGWKTEEYNELFLPGDKLDLIKFEDDKTISLTAQWEELHYVMTFDTFDFPNVLPMNIPFSEIPLNQDGTKLLLTDDMFPQFSLSLISYGWKIKGDKSGNVYRSGDELPIKSYDFELADACPFPNSNGYLVTFDANGGETAPSPQLIQPDGTKILTSEEPTRAYHHFMGWATSPDSANAEYAPGSRIPIYNSITLYAVWLGGGARIKYETGVSEIDPYPACDLPVCQLYHYSCLSDGMRLSSQIPERTGYIFDGWSCDVPFYSVYDNALKMTCYPGETIQIPNINEDNYYDHVYDTITLAAKWKPDPSFEHEFPAKEDYWHKCKITFDANGGEETPEPQYVSMGACDILRYEEPKRTYYHFMGWATAPDKYDVEYAPGSLIETVNDMTLYAVWLGGCPRIRFESGVLRDCATPAYDMPKTMLYAMGHVLGEEKLKLPDRAPSRIGFIFDGWECDESYILNDDGSIYFDHISADDYFEHAFDVITFTAKWRPVNEDQFYDVNFYDGYNGGNSLSHIKVRKGDKYCNDYSNGYSIENKDLPPLHDFIEGINYFAWGAPDGGVLTKDSVVSASGDHDIYAISFGNDPFEDMITHRWANKAVGICKYLGYISGTSETKYSPGAHATRYQAAVILSRAEGAAPAENNPFYDIKTDSDKNSVVTWAWQNGISSGSDGAFLPDDIITRAELVAFLYRFAIHKGTISGEETYDIAEYNDFNQVSDWSKDSMKWAIANGIITADDENNLRPNDFVTRAELAVFMLRTFVYTGVIPYCY